MHISCPPYQIPVRTHPRRRRMALVLTPAGVEVRVPPHASCEAIRSFVCAQRAWIAQALAQWPVAQTFLWGEPQLVTRQQAREALQAFVQTRLPHWAQRMGRFPQQVALRDMKSRWGSCSSRGRIAFALNLAQLPPALADYVIVHELAHLHEMNHSPRFWAHVAAQLPDYAALRAQLRRWGRQIAPLDT